MNCVQCGDELPASAKFCKKCGCKVQPSDAGKTASRGLPSAPTPAYTTCPDCGALCKHDARFCNKCGCRFEEAPSFENTKRDLNTPLTKDEEKAILVFGNVQDSTSPAPAHNGERIDTSPAMVIGGAAALASSPAAVPAPSLRPADTADAQPKATPPQPREASNTPAVQPAARAAANAAPIPAAAENTPKPAQRNPMPDPVPQASGSGKWIALGVLALAALIGGGAWWWNTQGKNRIATTAPAPAPAAPVAPVAPAPAVVVPPPAVSAESALTPNETIEPTPVESAPVAPVVAAPPAAEPAPAVAPAQQEAPAPRPAPRKPVRKQTLDDLLS